MGKKKVFYGWWIMITAFMSMTFLFAPVVNLLSMFTDPVSSSLGVDRSQFTLYYTVVTLTGMVSAPFAGRIMKKVDARLYLSVCTALGIVAYLGMAVAPSIYVFYVAGVLQGIALVAGSVVPCSVLITNWFNKKRGLALGIALSGSGVGGVLLSPVVASLLSAVGWRGTYVALAILIAVTVLPFTLFVVRFQPSDKGLAPLGEAPAPAGSAVELPGLSQKQAMRTPAFWVLGIAIIVTAIAVNSMLINLTPYLTDVGMSLASASLLLSVSSGLVIVGKLVSGRLLDKINLRVMIIALGVCNMASFVCLLGASNLVWGFGYALFTGFGATALTIVPTTITSVVFGKKDFSGIFGVMSMCSSLGTALSPIFASAMLALTGSWEVLLITLIGVSVASIVLYNFALAIRPKFEQHEVDAPELATPIVSVAPAKAALTTKDAA